MAKSAEAKVEQYLSVCCQAPIDTAAFSDGRGFLTCSACSKVLAVEPRPGRKSS